MEISKRQRSKAKSVSQIVDPEAAIELATRLAYENRLDFAQSFSAAVVLAYVRIILARRPDAPDLLALPHLDGAILAQDARETAAQIAAALETLAPTEAAHAIGGLYTTLLPASFRARHGIFYTPPELVECLLIMTEEAGIDWKTARVPRPGMRGRCLSDRGRQPHGTRPLRRRASNRPTKHRRPSARV